MNGFHVSLLMFCICSEKRIGSGRIIEEFWNYAATVAVSEGVEKTDFTITERSLSDKSFDYQKASCDSDSVQVLELGIYSHTLHVIITLLPLQKNQP